jgi:hypothetical protein
MHKLSHLVEAEWKEHSHSPLYELGVAGETQRLVIGAPSGQPEPFERLALCLAPPYFLLYVLHTSRGEGELGRYQSSEISIEEFRSFMAEFGAYLSSDARFDLWLHSPSENATVVWDHHNQIFAYGPLDRFSTELRSLGFAEGTSAVPVPHQHNYRPECDAKATQLLSWFSWRRSSLRPEDEQ